MLGKLLGGVVSPLADSASEYGQEREKTKRWREWAKAQVEIAAASWRPALARALGGAVVLHVIVASALLLTWLYGVVTQSVWHEDIAPLWAVWLDYASELFLLATTFLTGYGVARSVFDKSGSKEPVVERVKGVFRPPRQAAAEEVERLKTRNTPSSIERLPEARVAPMKTVSFTNAIDMAILEREVKEEEGFRDHIYLDSEGFATYGYGTLVLEGDPEAGLPVGTKIPAARIDQQFKVRLQDAIRNARTVSRSFDDLPQDVKHVLVSMAYQLGGGGLSKFKNMLKAIDLRDGPEAARQALDSRWATQTPSRAKRMAERLSVLSSDVEFA